MEEGTVVSFHPDESDKKLFAKLIGLDLVHDSQYTWIISQALDNPLPDGWEQRVTPNDRAYYVKEDENIFQWEHPTTASYKKVFEQVTAEARKKEQERAQFQMDQERIMRGESPMMKKGELDKSSEKQVELSKEDALLHYKELLGDPAVDDLEPTSDKVKCPNFWKVFPEDVLEKLDMFEIMCSESESYLFWIARQACSVALPPGWESHTTGDAVANMAALRFGLDLEEEENQDIEFICYSCDKWGCNTLEERASMAILEHPSTEYFMEVVPVIRAEEEGTIAPPELCFYDDDEGTFFMFDFTTEERTPCDPPEDVDFVNSSVIHDVTSPSENNIDDLPTKNDEAESVIKQETISDVPAEEEPASNAYEEELAKYSPIFQTLVRDLIEVTDLEELKDYASQLELSLIGGTPQEFQILKEFFEAPLGKWIRTKDPEGIVHYYMHSNDGLVPCRSSDYRPRFLPVQKRMFLHRKAEKLKEKRKSILRRQTKCLQTFLQRRKSNKIGVLPITKEEDNPKPLKPKDLILETKGYNEKKQKSVKKIVKSIPKKFNMKQRYPKSLGIQSYVLQTNDSAFDDFNQQNETPSFEEQYDYIEDEAEIEFIPESKPIIDCKTEWIEMRPNIAEIKFFDATPKVETDTCSLPFLPGINSIKPVPHQRVTDRNTAKVVVPKEQLPNHGLQLYKILDKKRNNRMMKISKSEPQFSCADTDFESISSKIEEKVFTLKRFKPGM